MSSVSTESKRPWEKLGNTIHNYRSRPIGTAPRQVDSQIIKVLCAFLNGMIPVFFRGHAV